MFKGVFYEKKGKQNTLLRTNIMSKSAFLLKLCFFFPQKGAFFSCVFFFAQTHWEDWGHLIQLDMV